MTSGLIIARDNEDTIATAISSLKAVCDEIVVLDTGSTDRTPEVSTSNGAKVFFSDWYDDFSKSRNEAIGYCSGDIIITIDSDEELFAVDKISVSHPFENEQIGGLECSIKNILGQGQTATTHTYTRIFRNLKEIRYSGKIHEQIRPSIEGAGLMIVPATDLHILHYGYAENKPERIARNRSLLLEQIEDSDENDKDFLKYHLAETEFADGNNAAAYNLFSEIASNYRLTVDQQEKASLRMAQIKLANDDLEDDDTVLDFISDDINREGFRKYIKAAALLSGGKYKEALNLYQEKDVSMSEMVDKVMLEKAISSLKQVLSNK
jgi:glycosyltransferase involved in cell wall biosynthesis